MGTDIWARQRRSSGYDGCVNRHNESLMYVFMNIHILYIFDTNIDIYGIKYAETMYMYIYVCVCIHTIDSGQNCYVSMLAFVPLTKM
jgi:hypothetical protein